MDESLRLQYIQMATELLQGYQNGDFSNLENPPKIYYYAHLFTFGYLLKEMQNAESEDVYRQVWRFYMEQGRRTIQEKVRQGKRVKVAFLCNMASCWKCDAVYQLMTQDERLEVSLVVSPIFGAEPEDQARRWRSTRDWFRDHHYSFFEAYDEEAGVFHGWDDLCGMPDIVIHTTPWNTGFPPGLQTVNMPFTTLQVYIPYGIESASNQNDDYLIEDVFNNKFINLMWRVYEETRKTQEGFEIHSVLHGENVRFSGYPAMDYYYEKHTYSDDQVRALWHIPEDKDPSKVKKIIFAPHYTLLNGNASMVFSTFHKNGLFLQYLARKYGDQVAMIYRPHPNLANSVIQGGLFSSREEYDRYLEGWEQLPMGGCSLDGTYEALFDTSDAIIHDCDSFMAEYLYTQKPVLFLRRAEQCFAELGKAILPAFYQADGADYEGIEGFLRNVVIQGEDTLQAERKRAFLEELDYRSINGMLAAEYIYQDMMTALFDE